ncbi:hypothetical protein B9479_003641 [Cryptococcus floricola]|uniref:Uncharacterized protein n=1 Tax=Cryptococcus floricola TaxID=2591691 RepID=A0A5D3AZB3_9TREE|nr:hypothetical protein B9479_003641 [Cryptococcus floricola]
MSGDQPCYNYNYTDSSDGDFSQYTAEPDTYGGSYGTGTDASTGGHSGQSHSQGYVESPFGEGAEDEFLDPEEEQRMKDEQHDRALRQYLNRQKAIRKEAEKLKQSSSGGSRGSGSSNQGSSSSSKTKTAKKPKHAPAKKPSSSRSKQAAELPDIGEDEE